MIIDAFFAVSPSVWIQYQLIGAYDGQQVTLECYSQAFPKSINYWAKDNSGEIIHHSKYIILICILNTLGPKSNAKKSNIFSCFMTFVSKFLVIFDTYLLLAESNSPLKETFSIYGLPRLHSLEMKK